MPIKVRAKAIGYLGHIRNEGDEFLIQDEKAFSKEWMERVDVEPFELKPRTAPKQKREAQSKDLDVI